MPDHLMPALRNQQFNLVHNQLFTSHRTRRYKENSGCAFCGAETEDYHHLFVACEMARLTRVAVAHRGPRTGAAKELRYLRTRKEIAGTFEK